MNIYTIYKATNIINGKVYIGFDSNWPNRKLNHYYAHRSKKCPNYYFYRALKKHGWDNFEWTIIYQSLDLEHCLNKMETHFIIEYRSFVKFDNCNGYNATMGGQGTLGKKQPEYVKKIVSSASSIRNKNSRWYNNGIENRFTSDVLDESWVLGRLNQKPVNTGKNYYTNGVEHKLCYEHPGPGWKLGMKPLTSEEALKRSNNIKNAIIDRKYSNERKAKQSLEMLGSGKNIMTPDGFFTTSKLAAEHYSVSSSTISTWVSKRPTEFYYTSTFKRKNNNDNT